MASTAGPYGFQPVKNMAGGTVRTNAYTILSTYATNLYQDQAVKVGTDGTIQAAAAGDAIIGTLVEVKYTDTAGQPHVQNFWTASVAAQSGTAIEAICIDDPTAIYRCQGSSALAVTNVGNQFNLTGTSGGSTNHISTSALDVSTATSTTNRQFGLLGTDGSPASALTDAFPDVLVRISKHQYVSGPNGF